MTMIRHRRERIGQCSEAWSKITVVVTDKDTHPPILPDAIPYRAAAKLYL
jgi:hypothetical protein